MTIFYSRSFFLLGLSILYSILAKCSTVSDLKDLTVALHKLHNVLTDEHLENYKNKVENFVKDKTLSEADAKTVLQIISFLNYPKWREKSGILMGQCMLLIKSRLCDLNINEIILLYDVCA